MAVGTRHLDPDTQAAAEAQATAADATDTTDTATPAVETKEAANADTAQAAEQKPTDETPVETPESTDTTLDSKDATSDTGDSTNMDADKLDLNDQESVDKALADAGFSNEDLGKELATNDGKFSEETIKALKEKFDPDVIEKAAKEIEEQFAQEKDKVIADKRTEVESMNTFIYGELAGGDVEKGKDNLKVLSEWARENLDKDTLGVINAKLATGNKVVVKEGLETAVALWKKGQEKDMMTGDSMATNDAKPVEKAEPLSKDQYIQLMNTKKYNEDPEYAKKIDDRRRATMATEGFVTPEYHAKYRPAAR